MLGDGERRLRFGGGEEGKAVLLPVECDDGLLGGEWVKGAIEVGPVR